MDPSSIEAVAREMARQSSNHGGEIWIASLIVVGGALLTTFYVWKVLIPNGIAARENLEASRLNGVKLTEVVAVMGEVASKTFKVVLETHETSQQIHDRLKRMVSCMRVKTRAIEKISEKVGVDLKVEIGEMRGLLGSKIDDKDSLY